MTGNTCVTFTVILYDHFCMETRTDTGNLTRDEKWQVEIRSYEFKTEKIHIYDKKPEIEDSRCVRSFFFFFQITDFTKRTISILLFIHQNITATTPKIKINWYLCISV
jgi:hypothetical protein